MLSLEIQIYIFLSSNAIQAIHTWSSKAQPHLVVANARKKFTIATDPIQS